MEDKTQNILLVVGLVFFALGVSIFLLAINREEEGAYQQIHFGEDLFSSELLYKHYDCYVDVDFDEKLLLKMKSPDYSVPAGYVPEGMVKIPYNYYAISGEDIFLRKDVWSDTQKLFAAANADSHKFYINSGYRSYDRQAKLAANPFNAPRGGLDIAAKAGTSEHQLGTAVDIATSKEGYEWIAENAADYGFVLSFPEGAESQTGFVHEPWHIRYVGEDLAQKTVESGFAYNETDDLFYESPFSEEYFPYSYTGTSFGIAVFDQNGFRKIIENEGLGNLFNDGMFSLFEALTSDLENIDEYILPEDIVYEGQYDIQNPNLGEKVYQYSFKGEERVSLVSLADNKRYLLIIEKNEKNQSPQLVDFYSNKCF